MGDNPTLFHPATADDIVALLGEIRRSNAAIEANQAAIQAVLDRTSTTASSTDTTSGASTGSTPAPASTPPTDTNAPTQHGEHTPARAEHYDLLRSEKPIALSGGASQILQILQVESQAALSITAEIR